jgi:heme O synthase-like polyprenyltransferase
MYLVKKNAIWLWIETAIAGITIYQRWSSKRHTPAQLFVGFLSGTIVGIISYYGVKHIIQQQSIL